MPNTKDKIEGNMYKFYSYFSNYFLNNEDVYLCRIISEKISF